MSRRKPFTTLSNKQQSRIINEEVNDDIEQIFSDSDDELNPETFQVSTTFPNPSIIESEMMIVETPITKSFSTNNTLHQLVPSLDDSNSSIAIACSSTILQRNTQSSDHNVETHTITDNYERFISSLHIDSDDDENEDGFIDSDSDLSDDDSDEENYDEDDDDDDDDDTSILSNDHDGFNLKEALCEWYIECGNVGRERMNQLLLILREAGHTELPKDTRTLVRTPKSTVITECLPGEYVHIGIKTGLQQIISKFSLEEHILLDINIDGLPITKSTKRSLWPIQGKIVQSDIPPFVIGCYHGNEKPKSIEVFLKPFIDEYLILNESEFDYNNKKYKVTLRCVICDSPARNFCTATKQHNGYFGCGKCMEEGNFISSRMVFLNEMARLRTNENFRNREQEEHHRGYSPFERINMDMVNQFPLDYMHLVCLGITKLLLTMWIKINPKFSVENIETLSNKLMKLSKFVPIEFNRKPQPLIEINRWKATQFRLFLLYLGPLILTESLPEDYVMHFNVLSFAIRLLCTPSSTEQTINYAKELLVYFVQQFKILYGNKYVVSNVHNLIHLPEDVKRFGSLDNFSAFIYENNMQFIKKLLRKFNQPLQQLHRRLFEKMHPCSKKSQKQHNWPILLCKINHDIPLNCTNSHKKLQFEHFVLSTSRPNNCCILYDKSIVFIKFIGMNNGDIVIVGNKFIRKMNIKNYPLASIHANICEVMGLSDLQIFSARNISNKVCLFTLNNKNYVIPLLHH